MPSKLHQVAAIRDVPSGGMKEVKLGGRKILLANVNGEIHATAGECPHYGMSLAEGLLCGKRVICPWHKAVFDVTTGTLCEPPALDSLASYRVIVRDGIIFIDVPADSQPIESGTAEPRPDGRCFVLAGCGAAAVAAAQNLRTSGYLGRIVMLNPEKEPPYDRTKLSKEFLSAKATPEDLLLRPADFLDQNGIEVLPVALSKVDVRAHRVELSDGSSLHYDRLLLATGAKPKPVDWPGATLSNVFTLRSQRDAERILDKAKDAAHIVVVGGSFIAMEAASCFKTQGLSVTVVVAEKRPFAKQLGEQVGSILQTLHENKGVEFELEAEVESLAGSAAVEGVRLKSGKMIPADVVVIGTGVTPVTEYAHELSLAEDGGIRVDEKLKAAEDIYAAGDIAVFPEPYSGAYTRIEHWRVAEQHGRVAAGNMLGSEQPFDAVPYFWTNHFDTRFDYVGHAEAWDEVRLEQDKDDFPTFIALYFKSGRLVAASACQRDLEIATLHEAFRLRRIPADASLPREDVLDLVHSLDPCREVSSSQRE